MSASAIAAGILANGVGLPSSCSARSTAFWYVLLVTISSFAPLSLSVFAVSLPASPALMTSTLQSRRSPQNLRASSTAAKLIDAARNKTLTEREAKEVLAAYGVPVVGEKLVQSADEAAAAAKALGFPVALKVESPDLPHKTEAGVIRLGMKNEAEVKAAYEAVMANANKVTPPPRLNGVLVQPMISAGAEIMVGARIDPLFGPLVIAGLGGILVELLKDTSVELGLITQAEARAMLDRLKGRAMLTGFRGSEPVDLDKLADIIVRLAEFTVDQKDRIAELDVNPLICSGRRITAVDALIVKR